MDKEKLYEIVREGIEPKLKEQFYNGLMAGWSACAESLYKQAKDMTNASDIKKMLKEEKDKRHIKTTEDSE